MRMATHGTAAAGPADAARPGDAARPADAAAATEEGCPLVFADRYRAAYRAAYRLLGDPDRAVRIAREAVAGADAAVVPRSDRVRTVRACRAAAATALHETKEETPEPG